MDEDFATRSMNKGAYAAEIAYDMTEGMPEHTQMRNTSVSSETSVSSALSKDGKIGKQFKEDGKIGQTAQKLGGPFDKDGAIGKQFKADGRIGGSIQQNAERNSGR